MAQSKPAREAPTMALKSGELSDGGAEAGWDVCEIQLRIRPGAADEGAMYFDAVAVGATGKYRAGKSAPFAWAVASAERSADGRAGLAALAGLLADAGWQPLPRGRRWFSYRFRRAAAAAALQHPAGA
jgi:hypothetical protein